MEQYMRFIASTNLKSLLGKGLVTDQIAAIFELVKNSYDADADQVVISFKNLNTDSPYIVIADDGIGMSLDDIERKWMVIGTDSKKKKLYSSIYHRPLNGDKGIGRFSVDRLGEILDLSSVERNSGQEINMHFDWNEFENSYRNVSDVKIPYTLKKVQLRRTGVRLKISGLRDHWDEENIRKLIKNLRQLKSPFAREDTFKIFIDAPEAGYENYEIQSENLENISSLWVDVNCTKEKPDLVSLMVCRDGIEYEEVFTNKYVIGPLRVRVYIFTQGDKIRFKNRYSIRVREFGNIRLYRDEFRIYPYGEENNDWLDIDRRHAQGFARTFSAKDLTGYVQTYKEFNPGLIPLTNRQGLIESPEFEMLREFIVEYAIKTLERYYFQKFKAGRNETIENSKRQIEYSAKSLNDIARRVSEYDKGLGSDIKKYVGNIQKGQSEQLEYVKSQEELTQVYSRIAQKETFLHQLIHQALIDLKDARAAIESIESMEDAFRSPRARDSFLILKESVYAGMAKMLTVRDDVARTRKKVGLNLAAEIVAVLRKMRKQFEEYDIHVDTRLDESITYYMDKGDLTAIMNNLLSNSVKALREINDRKRRIQIELVNGNRNIIIKVRDNGCGIDRLNREKIFDPFFTTTEKYGGFGLGLTIVDEMLKEYRGTLELADTAETGACFLARLGR